MRLTRTTPPKEVWMRLIDHRKLAKLMVIQGVSHRELAAAAGWSSHSYVSRLVRGEIDTCKPEPAVRIARHLGVGTDDLFVTNVSATAGRSGKRRAA